MVEAIAVASGKGGTGKTTATLALGMALAEDGYDVTVVDADTGLANLLFHADLDDASVTLHDLLLGDADVTVADTEITDAEADFTVADATYDRFGMRVVPCGTDLGDFEAADPDRLADVVADLAADADVLLLDSPAALGSKSAVLPIVLADRVVVVLQPTIPALSDGLKVHEYAQAYGTDTAGVLYNRVHDPEDVDAVRGQTERYFDAPVLASVPAADVVRDARAAGEPLLAHAPDSTAADAFRAAAASLDPDDRDEAAVADRFASAVVPDRR